MGGSNSGNSKRRGTLPRTYSESSLAKADRRRAPVRLVIEGASHILEDGGGRDQASFLRIRMAHRAMHLDGILSRDELALAEGKEVDRASYLTAAQTWLRYATALGLERRSRPAKRMADFVSEAEGTAS